MKLTPELTATPWQAGRFDGRTGPPRLLFGRTFEDPTIECELFPPAGHVLCIASAGDTARALASSGRSVIAVDLNPAQIEEFRRRLGGDRPRRGEADRLLGIGRAALVPFGWRRSKLEHFCGLDDPEAQAREWDRLVTHPVRMAVGAALSRRTLRIAYTAAFSSLAPPRFGDVMLDRIARRVKLAPNNTNPWLAMLLTGRWTPAEPAVEREAIDLRCGDVASILEGLPAASLDGISLSNVLDGPGIAYRERLLAAARRAARPGGPIIVRTFLDAHDQAAVALANCDRSLLWGGITVHYA